MRRSRNLTFSLVVTLFIFALVFSMGAAAPATADASLAATADEQSMADLIDQARHDAGKASLTVDPVLSNLARIKAQDIASNCYFGHNSSTYGSPNDMLKMGGVQYSRAREVLAKACTVNAAFKGICAASSRSTILSSSYDRIGVGIITKNNNKIVVLLFTGGQKVTTPTPAPAPTPTPTPTPEPAPTPAPEPQPVNGLNADEQQMLDLVNQERSKAGLQPLQMDPALVKLARMKAQDMIDKNYFSHTSPTYGSPFDMMKSAGVQYRYAGENLAGASTVGSAHTNLMNSSGHRANILNANYTKVGIGVVSGGPYGKMFVQMFTG
ncbi:CAP domain-containing protein [Pelotomaculum terephthalicicum JT]|uniref:CAP domain-containing protein n=1 Tax=Pelotomaculum terephthalicicum TaxID=206393 RepID=UPI001F042233|nr:CAP domain-containing protein [Pelotomaculum terephthalicicum]MCG9968968.1 CAP domain-containing protein [Pelotomaculum terephthalicicum JT]